MEKIRFIISFPFALPFILIYLCSKQRDKIDLDTNAFYRVQQGKSPENYLYAFYKEFVLYREYRSLFYFRIGRYVKLISWLFPPQTHLTIDVPRDKFGGGCYLQHGYCTDISAESIGEGLFINQKVTIGWSKDGCPTVGRNCRIGTGAVVLGHIKIEDNVNIGANAIVVHNVPSNTTVCSPEAMIVKREGNAVREHLSQLDSTN